MSDRFVPFSGRGHKLAADGEPMSAAASSSAEARQSDSENPVEMIDLTDSTQTDKQAEEPKSSSRFADLKDKIKGILDVYEAWQCQITDTANTKQVLSHEIEDAKELLEIFEVALRYDDTDDDFLNSMEEQTNWQVDRFDHIRQICKPFLPADTDMSLAMRGIQTMMEPRCSLAKRIRRL